MLSPSHSQSSQAPWSVDEDMVLHRSFGECVNDKEAFSASAGMGFSGGSWCFLAWGQ